jgi:hypothetical protein
VNPAPNAPENGRAAEDATDSVSSSSRSGRLISAPTGSSTGGVRTPVSFSKAFLRYSSFSLSASAPRPLGSNFSLAPWFGTIFSALLPVAGEAGEEGKLGDVGIPRDTGREVSFRLGKEMELERV